MEFTPEQKALNDLFGNDMTYIIPEYQRPYSWDCLGKSDKNNQVNVMWQDLIEFYESKSPNIYFMGSMVVIGDGSSRQYEVVDGQQRLTTLTILLTAIKCFLNEVNNQKKFKAENEAEFREFIKASADNVDKLIFNEKRNGLFSKAEKKVKIEKGVGFDYDNVLKTIMECGHLSMLNLNNASDEQKQITQRYFDNRQYFIEKLEAQFLEANLLTYDKATDLGGFFDFLKNKVTVVQIRAPRFDVAYQIFEILNNRGLPLSNKDLFRNFLIKEFTALKATDTIKFASLDPNQKWRDLDTHYQLDAEFISRYVESKRGKSQQFSAYNDLEKEIYKSAEFKDTLTKSRIELFYTDIKTYLDIYTNVLNLHFDNKQIRNRINFLIHSGNLGYTLNLLMALLRHTKDTQKILDFLKVFEKYMLYIILGNAKRFKSSTIYGAIKLLNDKKINDSTKEFDLNPAQIDDFKSNLAQDILDNDIAKLLIARYYWAIENQTDEDVIVQTLDYGKATLEHIIPQNPDAKTNWVKDFSSAFRKHFTYKLGNMTLLTQKMNSAARNYDFSKKKLQYQQTKLTMTQNLSLPSVMMNEAFIQDRHSAILDILFEELDIQ